LTASKLLNTVIIKIIIIIIIIIISVQFIEGGGHYATNWKVVGSIPDEVIFKFT
jgi:hypothetical protein